MRNEKFQVRQGDVYIEYIAEIPKGAKKDQGKVLAYGEVTGHAHCIDKVNLDNVDIYVDEKGEMFLQAKTEATIVHDEHGPVTIPKGNFKVTRQRQFDADAADEERRVAD